MPLPSSSLSLRRPLHGALQTASADSQLFAVIALLLAVLIGDALLILTGTPSLADMASFYVTTT